MSQPEWIIPLKKRHDSPESRQGFLWRNGKIFIMDNHQAAAWCWAQAVPEAPHGILHLDAHYDLLTSRLEEWMPAMADRWSVSADEHLATTFKMTPGHEMFQVLRWDNYLPIYLTANKERIEQLVFVTQKCGDFPNSIREDFDPVEIPIWEASRLMDYTILKSGRWIVNLDIDLFFFQDSEGSHDRFWHKEGVTALSKQLGSLIKEPRCVAVTIALSPACCGGWRRAEEALGEVCEVLGIAFSLPSSPA